MVININYEIHREPSNFVDFENANRLIELNQKVIYRQLVNSALMLFNKKRNLGSVVFIDAKKATFNYPIRYLVFVCFEISDTETSFALMEVRKTLNAANPVPGPSVPSLAKLSNK